MTANGKKTKAEPAPPTTLFLFGAHGDLVKRLLMPALYNLSRDGLLGDGLRIVGVDHNAISDADFAKKLEDFIRTEAAGKVRGNADNALDPKLWAQLAKGISYVEGDFLDDSTYADIGKKIADSGTGNAVFYLATAPRFFSEVVQRLGSAGLLTETDDSFRRVVIEKPFGSDLATAEALNASLLKVMSEKQIYRIDHYLGKETVQNILALRFANTMFEPLWNQRYVDHVQITMAEDIGIGTRAGYYDTIGSARDVIQNHLLQLLALTAMEEPTSMEAAAVRLEKEKVLNCVRLERDGVLDLDLTTARGRYDAGFQGGLPVRGYLEEDGVAADSRTETFAALRLEIANRRWAGVPFYLRAGKRLTRRVTEVAVVFKQPPFLPFESAATTAVGANTIVLRIQPDEGITLRLASKVPGTQMELRDVSMDFGYGATFNEESPEAYERLILDALLGDAPLFPHQREVDLSWRILDPVIEHWSAGGSPEGYRPGSWGPASAHELLARDGRTWRRS